jgi:RNA polymerase sigma-70 factor (ECF subfamily)
MESQDEQELKSLMIQAAGGNRQAYKALLGRIEMLVRPFVKNILTRAALAGSGAEEDVVQEILLGVHSKRETFDPSQSFLPWMYAIARYKAIDYLRFAQARAVSRTSSIDDPESGLPQLAARGTSPTDRLEVEQALEKLPGKQRDLIRMMKLEGLSVQEASLRTGFSPSDVRVSVHRGLKALRKILGGSPDENG